MATTQNTFQFGYTTCSINELPEEARQLVEAAQRITPHAYAPYSNFKVGSAIRLSDKKVITGTNIENASYPAGICAERAALSGVLPLPAGLKIEAIAVYYITSGSQCTPIAPCGICRQVILEYRSAQQTPIEILLASPSGEVAVINDIVDLVPLHFNRESLK